MDTGRWKKGGNERKERVIESSNVFYRYRYILL